MHSAVLTRTGPHNLSGREPSMCPRLRENEISGPYAPMVLSTSANFSATCLRSSGDAFATIGKSLIRS